MAANTDGTANYPGPVLLALKKDDTLVIGLPPRHVQDNYDKRAITVGRASKVSLMTCSPDGDLYIVREGNLYVGQILGNENTDWFSGANIVGRYIWGSVRHIFFHPNGDLYAVSQEGALYKGPPPVNQHLNWLYETATLIGYKGWENFNKFAFHPDGELYGATNDNDRLVKRLPPTEPQSPWLKKSVKLDIGGFKGLIGFTPDGYLWIIHRERYLRRGPPPTKELGYYETAEKLEGDYNQYRFLCFTQDKTIQSFLSFEFLPDQGQIVNEAVEVVKEIVCDNRWRSTSILKESFEFKKTIKQLSSFNQEHGFTIAVGVSTKFTAGIPRIASNETSISLDTSTTHKWSFTETNETTVTFTANSNVTVEPGKGTRIVASVKTARMNIPYRARVRTLLGFETDIKGTWNGVARHNLTVKQEDLGWTPTCEA